jgi:hypothetical protein
MVNEDYRVPLDVCSGNYEFGMQYRDGRAYSPMCINKIQTLRRRLPPIVAAGGLFNPKQFKSPAYSVYTASGFVAWLGLYTGQLVSLEYGKTPGPDHLTHSANLHRRKRTITGRLGPPFLLPCRHRKCRLGCRPPILWLHRRPHRYVCCILCIDPPQRKIAIIY